MAGMVSYGESGIGQVLYGGVVHGKVWMCMEWSGLAGKAWLGLAGQGGVS